MSKKEVSSVSMETDHDYYQFENLIAERIKTAPARGPLFTTSAEGLFETYLNHLPEDARQHYNCRCCQRFIEKYGGLVQLPLPNGTQTPLLWSGESPGFFTDAANALFNKVFRSKVTGVFFSSTKTWGTPQTGEWTHLSGECPNVWISAVKSAEQAMAEKREEYVMLKRGLDEFRLDAAQQAVRVLEADALDRSERTLGCAKWFRDLHLTIDGKKGSSRDNLVWLAVAKAPPGWCHIRSSMIGTLLEDILTGMPYEVIRERWAKKMHPLQYQRPSTITEGAITRANKLVEQLGVGPALARRYATLADIVPLWLPVAAPVDEEKPKTGGVFDHLKPSAAKIKELDLPAKTMTWEKFRDTLLPDVLEMEYYTTNARGAYYGLVTAVDAQAPAILQWDGLPDQPRNPVSWYFYHRGSTPNHWGLEIGAWVKVNALFLRPSSWYLPEKMKHHGQAVYFALEGAKDKNERACGGFFPENLKTEYHEIRQVMERYARTTPIEGREEGNANGIAFQDNHKDVAYRLRLRTKSGWQEVVLDRWE